MEGVVEAEVEAEVVAEVDDAVEAGVEAAVDALVVVGEVAEELELVGRDELGVAIVVVLVELDALAVVVCVGAAVGIVNCLRNSLSCRIQDCTNSKSGEGILRFLHFLRSFDALLLVGLTSSRQNNFTRLRISRFS